MRQNRSTTQRQTFSIPLLVRNRTGYQNLCRLITLMKLRVPKHAKPGECAVTPEELAAHAEGLICLTGAEDGPLARAFHRRDAESTEEAQRTAEWLVDIFGKGNVYAELQRHFNREEEARNQAVVEIARQLASAATGHQRCLPCDSGSTRSRRRVHLHTKSCATGDRRTFAGKELRNVSESTQDDVPNFLRTCPKQSPTQSSCHHGWNSRLKISAMSFRNTRCPDGETMTSFLRKRTDEGARRRYTGQSGMPTYERARTQIERELALIEKLKLEGYFLIVWDIVQFCRREGILIQGRGSAANSAVCYSLGITAVDPVGMELLFERFLSEERGEWPDIDLDLPSGDQRERAIQYVYERYGKLGAAMTANVITYRGDDPRRVKLAKCSVLMKTRSAGWPGWCIPGNGKIRRIQPSASFAMRDWICSNPRIKKFFQLYQAVQDSAAASGPALGRHGDLPGPTQFGGAA